VNTVDYPSAWAQLYTWLGYHQGRGLSADSVRSKMRALTAPPPPLFDVDADAARAASAHLDRRYP
jgi:hypothetical protein